MRRIGRVRRVGRAVRLAARSATAGPFGPFRAAAAAATRAVRCVAVLRPECWWWWLCSSSALLAELRVQRVEAAAETRTLAAHDAQLLMAMRVVVVPGWCVGPRVVSGGVGVEEVEGDG